MLLLCAKTEASLDISLLEHSLVVSSVSGTVPNFHSSNSVAPCYFNTASSLLILIAHHLHVSLFWARFARERTKLFVPYFLLKMAHLISTTVYPLRASFGKAVATIQRSLIQVLISAMGFNRNMPLAVVFGPPSRGGIAT
jgi:hypothetical protein